MSLSYDLQLKIAADWITRFGVQQLYYTEVMISVIKFNVSIIALETINLLMDMFTNVRILPKLGYAASSSSLWWCDTI